MDTEEPFNLTTFTDTTKKVCTCSAISIFMALIFIVSPLRQFIFISLPIKLGVLLLLAYTLYLNNKQTNHLRNAGKSDVSSEVKSQLNMNIVCSYVFSLFILLLILFTIKSFF